MTAMGDSVKVTMIATGFAKPVEKRESVIEPVPAADFLANGRSANGCRHPVPAPPVAEPMEVEMDMGAFEEDLDVPAYLRQGKLLN